MPREFIWDERLKPTGRDSEWVVEVADDGQMDQWFEEIISGHLHEEASSAGVLDRMEAADAETDRRRGHPTRDKASQALTGADRWRRLWRAILENKRAGVLRSDLLRWVHSKQSAC